MVQSSPPTHGALPAELQTIMCPRKVFGSSQDDANLSIVGINALPAVAASIRRPGARSDHCYRYAQCSQQYAHPRIVRACKDVSQFNRRRECTADWSPNPYEQKNRYYRREYCDYGRLQRVPSRQRVNRLIHESSGSDQAQQQEPSTRPSMSER
jgi:hypothetical protein